jgi:ATP-dependent protease ClpP protease subunit
MTDGQELILEKMKLGSEFAVNFDDRTIHIFGELDDNIGASLRVRYDLLKQWVENVEGKVLSEITLDISSFGGSIYAINAALDFYHELGLKNVLVNTRAHGICMSAATLLLSGGTGKREALPRCRFMLHDVQIGGIEGTANQIAHTAKTITDEQMELFSLYAQFARRGKEPFEDEKGLKAEAKKWHKRFTKDGFDHYISAIEALELNLIDNVL